mgnify:CR=1 FL=1
MPPAPRAARAMPYAHPRESEALPAAVGTGPSATPPVPTARDAGMTVAATCVRVAAWRRSGAHSMDLDTVSYVFQSLDGTFTIKPRLSRRWRVKHDSMPWGDSFASAEEAARAHVRAAQRERIKASASTACRAP